MQGHVIRPKFGEGSDPEPKSISNSNPVTVDEFLVACWDVKVPITNRVRNAFGTGWGACQQPSHPHEQA